MDSARVPSACTDLLWRHALPPLENGAGALQASSMSPSKLAPRDLLFLPLTQLPLPSSLLAFLLASSRAPFFAPLPFGFPFFPFPFGCGPCPWAWAPNTIRLTILVSAPKSPFLLLSLPVSRGVAPPEGCGPA